MWGLMWALKNSFLVSMSTMYLNFDRRKTRLETVLHTLLICESQRSLLSMVIPRRRCSDTWSVFAPFWTRSSGKGDNWCFCLVAIVRERERERETHTHTHTHTYFHARTHAPPPPPYTHTHTYKSCVQKHYFIIPDNVNKNIKCTGT